MSESGESAPVPEGRGSRVYLDSAAELLVGLSRWQRLAAKVLGRSARAVGSAVGEMDARRRPVGRQGMEAEAQKFERQADEMAAGLTPEVLAQPPVSPDVAAGLVPTDPRWQRRAIEDLRESARSLRALAAERLASQE